MLPHVLDVGMFLCNMAAAITVSFQPDDKRGFPRAAWADYSDEGSTVIFLHYRVRVDSTAPALRVPRSYLPREADFYLLGAFQIDGHDGGARR